MDFVVDYNLPGNTATIEDNIGDVGRIGLPQIIQHQEQLLEDLEPQVHRSPMHPIRDCPVDILQCIFEWVILDPDAPYKWDKFATQLSHVCSRWRQAATSVAKFWSYSYLSLKKSHASHPDDFEAHWTRLVERIRNCEATIHIVDIDDSDAVWERFRKCRLDLLPNIQHLELWINTWAGADRLANDEGFYFPKFGLTSFHIRRNWLSDSSSSLTIDPGRILSRFSSITEVSLRGYNFLNLTTNAIFPDTRRLTLQCIKDTPLILLAQVFPGLDTLKMSEMRFRGHSGGDIIWPDLTTFATFSTDGIPWHRFKLPKLTRLQLPEMTVKGSLIDFLSYNPCSQHFNGRNLTGCYFDIAKCAPQILCLFMPASEASAVLQFPRISTLQLSQHSSGELSCELFEEIVRKFFLPSRQFMGDKDAAMKIMYSTRSFRIYVPEAEKFELQWKESPLLAGQLKDRARRN